MKFTHFFIDRPRFATVISALIVIFGALAYMALPVAQYPEISPPQVQVRAAYPGANAETVAETVATPIEQEVNGVEGMIYMSSQSSNDGAMTLNITFEPGTDLDTAQVLVQNRVAAAEPRLPEEVRRRGVTTTKNSPDILMAINLYSPKGTYDQEFLGNYAILEMNDKLKRLEGISNSMVYGASEYAMRLWLDPDRMAYMNLTAEDVLAAVRAQNIQVAGGALNKTPIPSQHPFELSVQTQGRLIDKAEFENIIVKASKDGGLVRLKDVARVELGSENYVTKGYLGEQPSVILLAFMRPGSNALDTSELLKDTIHKIAQEFPEDLEYKIIYNPTNYIEESIHEVYVTLIIAIVLVIFVILAFLQSWHTAIIPVIAIPISLIGTFGLMLMFGYSLNMLSLFGLVLAIGIVVDDAIIVVENVERKLHEGLGIKRATKETMDEVGSALVASALVLVAVFLPTVLMDGISGQFYKQFGVTIASSITISALVSLTLSPAMAAIFMKNLGADHQPHGIIAVPGEYFNRLMDWLSEKYGRMVALIVRRGMLMGVLYTVLILVAGFQLTKIPTGFIPEQDQGFTITMVNLPPGSSLERTDKVIQKVSQKILEIPDVLNSVAFAGYSAGTGTNATNMGAIFSQLKPMGERRDIHSIIGHMYAKMAAIDEATVINVSPPPVRGIGNAGGFSMMVQDRGNKGLQALEQAAWALAMAANAAPETTSAYTFFETQTPRIYLDIDRERARQLQVPLERVFSALEVNLGSTYVNDFNFLGRTFRVTAQADAPFRLTKDDILRIRVRSDNGNMVPIGSIATLADTSGPSRVPRYNLYPSAAVNGSTTPGFSSGQALERMETLAEQVLPDGFDFEWTGLAYQEKATGNTAIIIFSLAVLFVFLLLSAQYESWTLPLAIIMIVPMCLLSAGFGLILGGVDNNVLTQIGFVVLIGLAAKNAILIVEFAKQNEDAGMSRWDAAVEASRVRLRPILMTAFAFILGVLPLLFAGGPGFEMRYAIGLTVFSGMLGVTTFGLIFTPVFYVMCRKLAVWLDGETQQKTKKPIKEDS